MRRQMILLLAAAGLVACGGGEKPRTAAPAPLPLADLDDTERARVEIARTAAKRLFERLSTRLFDVVTEDGHAAAIAVCKEAAPRIAAEVGRELEITIGRTSHRLRNPSNAPPDWLAAGGIATASRPTAYRLPDGALGVTLPIPTKGMCLACHGDAGSISPEVRGSLASDYPEDRATGFSEGDLRGVFWVELPAERVE